MADLSPAAQAVRDAVLALYQEGRRVRDFAWRFERPIVTAALLALADHQCAIHDPPDWWDPDDRTRRELRNLAEELESTRQADR